MFRPQIPVNPQPTTLARPVIESTALAPHNPAPVPVPVAPAPVVRSGVQLTAGTLAALVGGGTAVALVIGAVLVSMLLAIAVTAVSVTVCAVVLRSLANNSSGLHR